jgi:hypothetical protein
MLRRAQCLAKPELPAARGVANVPGRPTKKGATGRDDGATFELASKKTVTCVFVVDAQCVKGVRSIYLYIYLFVCLSVYLSIY